MLALEVDSIYTLTTLLTGTKAAPGKISPSKPFPLPYFDDMEGKILPLSRPVWII